MDYLGGKEVSVQDSSMLACYVTWNGLPHPSQFANLSYDGMSHSVAFVICTYIMLN